ncbi:MAG: hypothetical protein AAF799_04185 [Myxococcota bacterium]
MQRSGDFTAAASGYLTPAYTDYKNAAAVVAKIKTHAANEKAFNKALDLARTRRAAFVKLQKEAPGTAPQVNVPGACAAPKAMLLLLEDGGQPGALTERWCGSPTMANPVEHFDETSGVRVRVTDRVFEYGNSVPPCLACDALLPLLLCDKDKPCHKK